MCTTSVLSLFLNGKGFDNDASYVVRSWYSTLLVVVIMVVVVAL